MPKDNSTQKGKRPNWDEYFVGVMDKIAERGTCDRGKIGALVTVNKRIVSTGYAGSPPGQPHCDEVGHLMHDVIDEENHQSKHCIRTIHAEQNVICQAAKHGSSLDGGTIYCKMTPCFVCAKMIVGVGIKRVVAQKRYHAEKRTVDLFKSAGVQLDVLEDKLEEYDNQ